MKIYSKILLCIILMLVLSCAPKVIIDSEAKSTGKADKAIATQAMAQDAYQELDAADNNSAGRSNQQDKTVATKQKVATDSRYRTDDRVKQQQDNAVMAQKELDCKMSGTDDCDALIADLLQGQGISYDEYNAVVNKRRPSGSYKEGQLLTVKKSFPLKDGYPVWFHDSNYGGYLGGIGGAKAQKNGGAPAQRKVAIIQAQADLARNIRVNVYTETLSERTLTSSRAISAYQEKFETMSRQEVDEYIKKPHIMDEWLNVNTGELFIWVVLPK